ncbi:unnamed protein product [Cuscuta campestris]|uniref:Uncharacterized protein n=1 Tax=Cuscuta campestris TaxID=132261 RepID=A0A484KW00_9ASTE|nr:unnamed protein product [Cuscuta campestris]
MEGGLQIHTHTLSRSSSGRPSVLRSSLCSALVPPSPTGQPAAAAAARSSAVIANQRRLPSSPSRRGFSRTRAAAFPSLFPIRAKFLQF